MFTGIIEEATVHHLEKKMIICTSRSANLPELKIDQSVAHNGVCLTVVEINNDLFKVTAIKEIQTKQIWGI